MGHFRSSNFIPPPSYIDTLRSVVDGKWYLSINPTDKGVDFMANNNRHSEWLWSVNVHGAVFDFIFGSFSARCSRAKKKYQSWVDKKNMIYFYSSEVVDIT